MCNTFGFTRLRSLVLRLPQNIREKDKFIEYIKHKSLPRAKSRNDQQTCQADPTLKPALEGTASATTPKAQAHFQSLWRTSWDRDWTDLDPHHYGTSSNTFQANPTLKATLEGTASASTPRPQGDLLRAANFNCRSMHLCLYANMPF